MAGTEQSSLWEPQEELMIPLIAITASFLIVLVLVGLLARRIDREREEAPPTQASQGRHS
jgi:hypothetical protein